MDLFNVKFIERDGCRLIATSNYNYAMISPKIAVKNWRTVSVNGDKVLIVTNSGEIITRSRIDLGEPDRAFLESLRDEIANSNYGYSHTYSGGGFSGGGMGGGMISSSSMSGDSSTSFSSSTGGFTSTSISNGGQGGSFQANDLSVNMRDETNFSVSKSDLPFNWSRVFFSNDLVTFVYRDGTVEMRPISSLSPSQLEATEKLRLEVRAMQRSQSQQFSNTMQHSMDMVSNIFSSIMGQFPKPPSYSSAVGGMFGNNFPFGPDNSPFAASSGWPLSGGGAFAMAGR